jgi:nucleoside phosphorylase
MTRIAIIAAMPGELKPLVCGWEHECRNRVEIWQWRFDEGEWVAACAGAGVDAAARAFAEIEKDGPVSFVISTGWAGALSEEFEAGSAYRVCGVVDARTGERFETARSADGVQIGKGAFPQGLKPSESYRSVSGTAEEAAEKSRKMGEYPEMHPSGAKAHPLLSASCGTTKVVPCYKAQPTRSFSAASGAVPFQNACWLVTSPRVADQAEKLRLAAAYGAGLVDMEAAAIARLAQMRGIHFYCIKGVSDGLGEKLPDFNRFIAPDGRFKIVRFVLFAVVRPWYWPALVRMGENGKKAAQGIAESLLDFLDEREYIRKRNGYPNLKH